MPPTASRNIPDFIERHRQVVLGAVLVTLLLLSIIPYFVARGFVQKEERTILVEHADRATVAVTERFDELRASTRSIGLSLKASNNEKTFENQATPLIVGGVFSGIGVIDLNATPPVFRYSAGQAPGVGESLSASMQAAIARMSPTVVNAAYTDVDNGPPRMVTLQSAIGPSGSIVYSEVPFSVLNRNNALEIFGIENKVNYELYLGNDTNRDQLVATSDREALKGERIETNISVGGIPFRLVAEQAEPLVGGFDRFLPLFLLFGGFGVSFIVWWLLRQALQRNEEVIRVANERDKEALNILDAAHEAFVSFRLDGTVLRWSKTATELFGWERSEALGKRAVDLFVPPELADEEGGVGDLLGMSQASFREGRLEFNAVCKDGRRMPVELTIWQGTFNGEPSMKTLSRDVTEQRQIMEELARSRTAALEASRLKSEFLANMSHEIRTPMNGVIGMTDLLLRTPLSSDQREYAETVRSSADALLTVINDILDFSKIEAGKLSMDETDFDLRQVVNSSVELMAEKAATKQIELICGIDPNLPFTVSGDAHRLRQVLVNLVSNAVKFTDEGEVVVQVSTMDEDDESTLIRFDVRDTGIGVPAKAQRRLFESFEQVDMSSSRRHEGTGLGLPIAKRLCTLMGGEIGFQSIENVGSTFWFTVRVKKRAPVVSVEGVSTFELEGVPVFIIDDNTTNRRMLNRLTASWGMEPAEAASAAEGFTQLKRAQQAGKPYPLVLLDHHMPHEDGLSLAKRMRDTPELAGSQVILLASSSDTISRAELGEAGIVKSMNKPIGHDALRRCIMDVLSQGDREELAVPRTSTGVEIPRGTRVLVAEDHPVNQKVTSTILEQAGCEVDVVSSGSEAVDAARSGNYAMVFMDCQMPGMDGYEATKRIRDTESVGEHLPIVALTASAMKGDRERALGAGMDDHLPKPVRSDELINAVKQWGCGAAQGVEDTTRAPAPRIDVAGSSYSGPGDASTPSFDDAVLDNLRTAFGGNENQLKELLEQFVLHANSDLVQLKVANAGGDHETVKRVAHKLKGGGGTIGATRIVECAETIEVASGDQGRTLELLDELEGLVAAAMAAVDLTASSQSEGSSA